MDTKKNTKKLNKRILTGFLSAAMAARLAQGDMDLSLRKEELDSPVRIVFADEVDPPAAPKEPAVMKAQEQKPTKTRLSMRSLTRHFWDLLRGTDGKEAQTEDLTAEIKDSDAKPVSPIRFLLQPFYPVLAFIIALFFTLVWPIPGLFSKIREKFRSTLSFHRFSLLMKVLSVPLLVAVYILIPQERRGWLYFFLILWAGLMLILAIWSFFSKHRSESVIVLVPSNSEELQS